MPDNNATRTLKQTRADLVEALEDLQLDRLLDFASSIKRTRNPKGGKHIEITLQYKTAPEQS